MNGVFLALMTLLAQADNPEPLADLATVQHAGVEGVLDSKPALLAQHRGYLAWLEKHPAIASAEEAFTALMLTRGFSLPASRFDETLVQFPDSATRMDAYYAFLAGNSDARMAVDDLHRFEFAHRSSQDTWGAVLAHLRAEPDNAMTFLENPRWVKPIPEVLQPLADAARKGEPAVERLRADFQTLHNNAEVHLRVIPWWNTAYSAANPVGTAFAGLSAHFRQFPHRFWVWHRRELALADQPEARAWIRHWHRLVRRTDGLDGAYWAYLDALRRQPELGEAAEKRWQNEHGETLPWPPEGSPSTLTPLWTPPDGRPSVKRPEPRAIEKPARPEAPRADFPRPARPARPVPPERPVKDEETGQGEGADGQ